MARKQERFNFPTCEIRATKDATGTRFVEGLLPYGTPSAGLPWIETISRGAFADALNLGADVLALRDHNPTNLLGRTLSGTLTLTDSPVGLQFRIALPNTSVALDLIESLTRKDIDGSSFGFVCKPSGDTWGQDGAGNLTRSLNAVDLYEISVTSFAAFPDSGAALRSMVPKEFRSLLKLSKRMNDQGCDCPCDECQSDDCDECSNPDCDFDCPNCPEQEEDGDSEDHSKPLTWSERTLLKLEVLSRQ